MSANLEPDTDIGLCACSRSWPSPGA